MAELRGVRETGAHVVSPLDQGHVDSFGGARARVGLGRTHG
jgi:hypothetical protein